MNLNDAGWRDALATQFETYFADGLMPARIIRQERDRFRLASAAGDIEGVVRGRLLNAPDAEENLPVAGDWVAVRPLAGEAKAVVEEILPRQSQLARQAAGTKLTDRQVIAANVDTAFIVMGLDGDYNLRRLERYLVLVEQSNIRPVVVLNKSDVASDLTKQLIDTMNVAGEATVVPISAESGLGVSDLDPYLGAGETIVCIGSSGVGKSTLINRLLGENQMVTQEVRLDDSKGKHTTTHREVLKLKSGALIIDTPGIRELAHFFGESGGASTTNVFADIEELGTTCRFRDCAHESEPDCAIQTALSDGSLDTGHYKNYLKLLAEERFQRAKESQAFALSQKKERRAFAKSVRHKTRANPKVP